MQYVVYCVCSLLLFPNALQTSLYYYSAPCPSASQHIPEMLYHTITFDYPLTLIYLAIIQIICVVVLPTPVL
jgi:hypothetical protein